MSTYIVTRSTSLDPIFQFAQQRSLDMYKARVYQQGRVQWVIIVPPGTVETRFLAEFAQSVELIIAV